MERVVYLLGAGFSAPLGLPVISNFLMKSKDMYSEDSNRYNHFETVFDKIREISVCKNYYESDLFNIEEILSILEIDKYTGAGDSAVSFQRYIKDVIKHYTPDLEPHRESSGREELPNNWHPHIFGDTLWKGYGFFIGGIHNLSFQRISIDEEKRQDLTQPPLIKCSCGRNPDAETSYSLITLNYDLIPETVCRFINGNYIVDNEIAFITEADEGMKGGQNRPILAKLHGSIDSTIVPPTWSKGPIESEISGAWKLAYKYLTEANHIRIIGYSLPITDTYVKYLLKSAATESLNLKSIDVICMDPDHSVEKRYKDFIIFDHSRFADENITRYFDAIFVRQVPASRDVKMVTLDKLEKAHERFMEQYSKALK